MPAKNDSLLLTLLQEATSVFNDAANGSKEALEKVGDVTSRLLAESFNRLSDGRKLSAEEKQAVAEKDTAFDRYIQTERDKIAKMKQEITELKEKRAEANRTIQTIDSLDTD